LIELLRRAAPIRLLELLAATPPWSERPLVLAGVALCPRAPRALVLRLLPSLYWRSLAELAATPRMEGPARVRAEALLLERLPDLRLGERITLARIATPPVLPPLLADADLKVVDACLQNRRLREEDLLVALRSDGVPRTLLEAVAASTRWGACYAVGLALVRQPRTPLALSLSRLSSLVGRDLREIAASESSRPLLALAAQRLLAAGHGTPRDSSR
jgi:hypothetical protein